MEIPENILTAEEATIRVNGMPFPAAVDGDSVKQFGYWFDLTSAVWTCRPDQPCVKTQWLAEQARIEAELLAQSEAPNV